MVNGNMKYPALYIGSDFGRVDFTFFGVALHSHPRGDTSPCPMRVGIRFTLFGIHATFGIVDSEAHGFDV